MYSSERNNKMYAHRFRCLLDDDEHTTNSTPHTYEFTPLTYSEQT